MARPEHDRGLDRQYVIQAMGVAQWNLGLGKESQRSSGYGGFAGYNWQWDDVVIGLEMSYLHGHFGGTATATEALETERPLSDGTFHCCFGDFVVLDLDFGHGDVSRACGLCLGCFLPYVFGGFALGNANISRTVTVQDFVSATPFRGVTQLAPLSATTPCTIT